MAYEWMIDLCNRTQRDMWVCVPHFADEHYMYQLACLIRDSLDPSLRCYAEWSNETWNGRNALLDAIDVAELTRVQRRSVNHWNSGEFGYKDLLRR